MAAPQLEKKTPEQDEEESQDDQGILNRGMYYRKQALKYTVAVHVCIVINVRVV